MSTRAPLSVAFLSPLLDPSGLSVGPGVPGLPILLLLMVVVVVVVMVGFLSHILPHFSTAQSSL